MIPYNDMMSKADRIKVMKTKRDTSRPINFKERKVLLASLDAYKRAGSEDSKMILSSVRDILGFS